MSKWQYTLSLDEMLSMRELIAYHKAIVEVKQELNEEISNQELINAQKAKEVSKVLSEKELIVD